MWWDVTSHRVYVISKRTWIFYYEMEQSQCEIFKATTQILHEDKTCLGSFTTSIPPSDFLPEGGDCLLPYCVV